MVGQGKVRQGIMILNNVKVGPGEVWPGRVGPGGAWPGVAKQGKVRKQKHKMEVLLWRTSRFESKA